MAEDQEIGTIEEVVEFLEDGEIGLTDVVIELFQFLGYGGEIRCSIG
jgi:hypothetical protein